MKQVFTYSKKRIAKNNALIEYSWKVRDYLKGDLPENTLLKASKNNVCTIDGFQFNYQTSITDDQKYECEFDDEIVVAEVKDLPIDLFHLKHLGIITADTESIWPRVTVNGVKQGKLNRKL